MGKILALPPNFDTALAREAGGLIANAYEQFNLRDKWTLKAGYEMLAPLAAIPKGLLGHKEPFGFVVRNVATRVVFAVFRGTESPEDWLSNLAFPQLQHPWGKIEEGFSKVYAQCSADVLRGVRSAGQASIVVTGHSLGGALAAVCAADLAINGFQISMYTFASPRVGNIAFAKKFDAMVATAFRLLNTEDVVTTVPFAAVVVGLKMLGFQPHLDFQHVGIPAAFSVNNGTVIDNHKMPTYLEALS